MLPCPNNTNGILLPQLSPPPPPPVFSLGNDETLLPYDPHDLLSQYCLLQESFIIDHYDNKQHTEAGRTTTTTTYAMEKNDGRHSKIFTATGPRDRRVRLSKDIARKFFDLQDLLGFDRASKTLDWLLRKSKPAIKELIKPIISSHMYSSTLCCSPSSSSSSSASECENLEKSKKMNNNNNNKQKKQKRRINPSSGKKRKPVHDRIIMMAKEMRAKARERARERTKEKLFLREVMNYGYSFSSCLQAPNNLILSRESSSNFSHWSPATATRQENWDISSAVTSSNSSSCFHPLNNMISTSSSSPVLQIRRKPFDLSEYNNSNNNHGLMW